MRLEIVEFHPSASQRNGRNHARPAVHHAARLVPAAAPADHLWMPRVHRPAARRRLSATLLAAPHFWRKHIPPKRGFDVCELTPIDVVKPPIRRTWPAHTG